MAAVLSVLALGLVVAVHTVVAAVTTRFFRVRMETRVGSVVFTLLLTPIALLVSTFVLSGALGLGPTLGGSGQVIFLMIVTPLTLGIAIDYVWMPAPEEVTLPESAE